MIARKRVATFGRTDATKVREGLFLAPPS